MNWNVIQKSWDEFARYHNTVLIYDERNLFHAIECKYNVHFQTKYGKSHFSGVLWKSTAGDNRNQTKISVKFTTDQSLKNFELSNRGILSLFYNTRLNDIEENIFRDLKRLNGKSLLLKDNALELKLNGILSSKSDFEKITQLINSIKTNR